MTTTKTNDAQAPEPVRQTVDGWEIDGIGMMVCAAGPGGEVHVVGEFVGIDGVAPARVVEAAIAMARGET